MEITKEQVQYIAKLAKLRLDETQAEKMQREFDSILRHFASMDQLELSDVDEDQPGAGMPMVLRRDETTLFSDKEKLFQNVKVKRDGYIQVPKIIE